MKKREKEYMKSKTVIKIAGMPDGTFTPFDGLYLESFDFEYQNGCGRGTFTNDLDKAMQFDNSDAFDFYRTQPKCNPMRWDGRPNRPLTATNVVFETIENILKRTQNAPATASR